jgi:DNA-binding PadR family transcriptional regulator
MPRQSSPLSFEYILLGFLERAPIHGYDLFKRLNNLESIGMVWTIKQSQLYALLERLEEEGLVTSTVIPGESRPNRKQFHITSVGQQTFYAWRGSPVQHGREIRQEFLAKLYFTLQVDNDTTLELIEAQRGLCYDWINDIEYSLDNSSESQLFEKIVYQYRITQIQAILNWLNEIKKEINQASKKK